MLEQTASGLINGGSQMSVKAISLAGPGEPLTKDPGHNRSGVPEHPTSDGKLTRVLAAIGAEPWLITSEAFSQIRAIAERANASPDAVATRLGRPLDNTRKVRVHGDTALIPVIGPIFRYANLFTEISGATSLQALAQDFQTAIDDPKIARIVLHMDTPGGQSTGIAELASLVRAADKHVAAYVGDMAASAGYWIASHASEIIVSPTALLGSIGVVVTYWPDKEKPVEIVSNQSPLKLADPQTDAGRAEAQRIVDQLAAVFVSAVADARGVSEERVLNHFGRGSLLVGQHAIDAGMADRIATLNSLLAGSAPGANIRRLPSMSDSKTTGAPTIDRAYLDANHPDLVAQIRAEGESAGLEAGKKAGADDERQRIQDVRAQHVPGHEALIEELAADGHTTGPEAAVQVLAAERALREQAKTTIINAPGPVNDPPKSETQADTKVVRIDARAIYADRRAGARK